MEHQELTKKILQSAFEVSNNLGVGFLESVYERALCIFLNDQGVLFEQQKTIEVSYKNTIVGTFFADLIVENKIILELKATKQIIPEHEAQLLSYLKATKLPIGMILNFGQPKLQYRRYKNRFLSL